MTLELALSMVRDAGYRVSKPRQFTVSQRVHGLHLNAVGKPYGTQFDPSYRMKYKPRKYAPGGGEVGGGISPETWAAMCQAAQAAWDARAKADFTMDELLQAEPNGE